MFVGNTSDGGKHWTQGHFPVSDGAESVAIQFLDSQHGYILATGEPAAGQLEKQVYRTSNGGHSWKKMTAPVRDKSGYFGFYPSSMTFRSPLAGWSIDILWYTQTYRRFDRYFSQTGLSDASGE